MRTGSKARRFQEKATSRIEARAAALIASGETRAWFGAADPATRAVSRGVNGLLLAELAARAGHCDLDAVEFFRSGAPLVGHLPRSGLGEPIDGASCVPVEALRDAATRQNSSVLKKRLRPDPHAEVLHEATRADAELGRMTEPVDLAQIDTAGAVLVPRFSVEQGIRADGTPKMRSIDDCSIAGLNGATAPGEKHRHDTVDALRQASAALHAALPSERWSLFKAVIDSAFRRVPIQASHR